MSIQALSWVIEYSKSRLADRCVLMAIGNHCDREGQNAWPSIETISHEGKVSRRQAQVSISRLSKAGELSIARNQGPHGTNLYSLPLMTEGNLSLLAEVAGSDKGGENSAGVKTLRGEKSSGRVHIPSSKRQHSSPEPSLEPTQEPSFHIQHEPISRRDDKRLFERELNDMKRRGPVGEATRRHWRQLLDDPNEAVEVPDWFRREAEQVLREYGESVLCGNSIRRQQSK